MVINLQPWPIYSVIHVVCSLKCENDTICFSLSLSPLCRSTSVTRRVNGAEPWSINGVMHGHKHGHNGKTDLPDLLKAVCRMSALVHASPDLSRPNWWGTNTSFKRSEAGEEDSSMYVGIWYSTMIIQIFLFLFLLSLWWDKEKCISI